MADEIPVGDMTYVSSKRASDISGYAQDYIGQLARSGQIEAKRIGGLWYISMPSLEGYKTKSEQGNLEAIKPIQTVLPEKDPEVLVSFDGKDYISANRASKITGYNQDYVGQLARSGKVLSRQVGNRWYVDRDGILAHKSEKDALLAAVQSESVGLKPIEMRNQQSDIRGTSTESITLLKYEPEDLIVKPLIENKTDEESLYTSKPNDPQIRTLTSDEYDIPVQVRRYSSDTDENHAPIDLRPKQVNKKEVVATPVYKPPQQRPKRPVKIRISNGVIVTVALILLIGSLGAYYWHVRSEDTSASPNLSTVVTQVGQTSGRVLNGIMTTLENWIVPTLYYKRS